MYTLYPDHVAREGRWIPLDPENADYKWYLEWIGDGNTPELPPVPTLSELIVRARAEIRVQRQPIIEILDGLQASALTHGDTPRAQIIETAKQGLRDLTDIDLTDCLTYDAMRLKVKARYVELALALPADIRKSFSEAVN